MNGIDDDTAREYARWFACLADPTRIAVLHTVAAAGEPLTVGEIVEAVGRSQSTVSAHLRRLAEERYVFCEPAGVTTRVRVNEACMSQLPEAAAAIMAASRPGVDR